MILQFDDNSLKKLIMVRQLICFLLIIFASLAVNARQPNIAHLNNDWGIEPVHLRVTADGYMIEFRYKILDAEKALVLSDRKHFPHLLSLKSQAKLSVPYFPTVGFVKSNRRFIKEGKNYIALFSNEGRHLLPGDQVKLQIRDKVSPLLTLQ